MLDERTSRGLQLVVAITAALAMLFQCDLVGGMLLFYLALPALAFFAAVQLLALDAIVARLRRRPARHLKTALVLAVALGPAFPWINVPFQWLSAAHKLLRNQSHYEQLIVRADAGEQVPGIYDTGPGPTPRYEFVFGGITDNRLGVVHDRSRTFGDAPPDEWVLVLHLWGPWYFVQHT
ncbi:MAG: hypothetical protein WAT39_05465 [Planctomycetota bacterium]